MGRAIVLCAGDYVRWTLPYPKQLWKIPGTSETLLSRTLRLALGTGWEAVVATHRLDIQNVTLAAGARWIEPAQRRWTCETWLSTRAEWGDGRVAVLLGDVFWTERDLLDVFREQGTLRVHGHHVELFAITYGLEEFGKVEETLRVVIADAEAKGDVVGVGKVWNFYRAWCGFPLHDHQLEEKVLRRRSDDLTRDLDTEEAVRKLTADLLGQKGWR